jgi:sigma-B regulation protein RsbU (phosphoserine phosphatase)
MPDTPRTAAATPGSDTRALAGLRHDMRTLLNAILGYTALWLEDVPRTADPHLAESLEQIHALGRTILEQVNELLADSRLADPSYTASLGERLRRELSAAVRDVVSNTSQLSAACASESEQLAEDLGKIEAAGRRLEGMLANVESMAAPGDADAERLSPARTHSRIAQVERGRVLVVDDNEVNRDLLSRRLARDGYVVDLAENGAQALAAIENGSYDLLLLDIMMPVLNGYETLERIRSDARWSDLPVIMISSLDEMDRVIRCIEMGAEDYLPKPFDPVLLRARAGACVERKRLRDERAVREKAEQRRMRQELEMAACVQRRLLPDCIPQVEGLDLAGGCEPMREVGGDYFDFLPLDESHLGLVAADVAGKGMPAALVMATLAASLRNQVHQCEGRAAPLAEALNAQMNAWTDTGKFVTLFYGCLEIPSRRLRYVNAGHNLPLLARAAKQKAAAIGDAGGPVLGVLPDAHYEEGILDLAKGDVLVAYTDGVTEAFNAQDEDFGEDRLAAAVMRHRDKSAAGIQEAIMADVREWRGEAPQSDDVTLVVLKVV